MLIARDKNPEPSAEDSRRRGLSQHRQMIKDVVGASPAAGYGAKRLSPRYRRGIITASKRGVADESASHTRA